MSDYEIMLADSEYWAGCISGKEFLEAVTETGVAQIAFLETEYGKINGCGGEYFSTKSFDHRSWFSLLIAEAEKTSEELIVENWPFPVVHGRIPE
jgi:hypothetical protein